MVTLIDKIAQSMAYEVKVNSISSSKGNSFDSVYRFERHILFPKLLAQNCPDYELSNCMYNADGDKEGTLRRFLCNNIGEATNVYSIEASMYGFATDDKENPIRPYTEEDCEAF